MTSGRMKHLLGRVQSQEYQLQIQGTELVRTGDGQSLAFAFFAGPEKLTWYEKTFSLKWKFIDYFWVQFW